MASLLPILWVLVWFTARWELEGGEVWWRLKILFGAFQPFGVLPAVALPASVIAAVMTLLIPGRR